jgi:tRNA A-37 threonylcarbamoyl transferase component Bud32
VVGFKVSKSCEKLIQALNSKPESEQKIVNYLSERLKISLGISELCYLGFEERSFNYLFRFTETGPQNRKIFVKLSRLAKSDQSVYLPGHWHLSKESFSTLSYLRSAFPQNSKLAVPTPYVEFCKYSGFAREWVEGDCLVNFMPLGRWYASKDSHQKLKSHFRDVGEAIGTLHFKTYDPTRCVAEESVKQYIENLSGWFKKFRFNIYSRAISSAMKFLKQAESEIRWDQVGTSWVHGDLIPANIIITKNGKASLIDYEHSHFDSPLFDTSWFVVRTMIDSGWMPHKYSNRFLNELNLAFISGYKQTFKVNFDEKLFRLYCILNTLQCLYVEYNTSVAVFFRNNYAALFLKNYLDTYKATDY